ncbi:hypothetical protein HPB50_029436 [Hyalomma asiaticum]|nr:hypothetical protein HPB50_029436 [Hyalomma asiaticum]
MRIVTGRESKEKLCCLLGTNKFSLIVDEATDSSCCKHLCLLMRVFDGERVVDAFFDLIHLQDATAQDMYDHIVVAFAKWKVPYKQNMVGFDADGTNVMMGTRNSPMTRLQEHIPNLFVMKCICHSFHLCASYAYETLPRVVQDEVRDIYNYFHASPKRQCSGAPYALPALAHLCADRSASTALRETREIKNRPHLNFRCVLTYLPPLVYTPLSIGVVCRDHYSLVTRT